MLRFSLLGLFVSAGALIAHAAPEPLTPEDFAKPPVVSSLSMSLEGDMMVGLVTDPEDPDKLAAAYWDLSGNIDTSKPLIPSNITQASGKTMFRGAQALKNKKSLWYTVQPYEGALMGCGEGKTTGSTKKYLQKVYMGNEKIKKIDDLPDGRAEVGADRMLLRCYELVGETNLAKLIPSHDEEILISRSTTKNGTSYFRHNLRTGKERFVYKSSPFEGFSINNEGEVTRKIKTEFKDGEWREFISLKSPNSDRLELEESLTTILKERYVLSVLGGTLDDKKHYIATDKFTDKVTVYIYDSETNEFEDEPFLAHPEFNIIDLVWDSFDTDKDVIIGFRYAGPVDKVFWLDPEMKGIQDALEGIFPEKHVSISDYTEDRNRILFSVSAGNMPPAYYLLLDKSRLAVIGSERPWIKEEQLGASEFVYYTARDGMKIPALLTLPAGYEKGQKARGAIILPHGGPWVRDYDYFDNSGWTQYFANRGYIVMRPQYRGSIGWGRELWIAGDAQWGLSMQDDKDDGAAWLVDQGYVDADKIAIHGYSYGGFAAIAASVRPNSPYQCAIAGAGVANLARLGNEWSNNRIQRILQGDTVKGMDPQDNTDKINIPIMLYHGDYDVRVPLFHSRDFYNAIKKDSPESELLVLKQMGHQSNKWLPEHKATLLQEMERYLTTVCGM